ncbi:MAG: helix-turn-helix domain-containing protein [Synergistaceae bacterium]|nr:helix-turn-helix domain-containing protein [Synergistaceae bacterium]
MTETNYYTVSEVSKILGLTEYTIRKKIRDGDLRAIRGASDRDGYKIPRDALRDYANGKKLPELASALGLGFVAGLGIASLASDNSTRKKHADFKKIRDLSIASLQDEIDATDYYIQAMELDDNPTKEEKKKILEAKAKIKTLERQIKEIKLKFELNKSD